MQHLEPQDLSKELNTPAICLTTRIPSQKRHTDSGISKSVQCGLRPAREKGPRVEAEVVDGKFKMVHSYGHAGAG